MHTDLKVDFFDGSYSKASFYSGIFDSTAAAISFFTYPIFGAASDLYGRKRVMFVCNLLVALPTFALAAEISFWAYLSLRLLAGTSGLASVAYAYLADSLVPSQRAKYFGRAASMVGLGFVVGPVLCLWIGREVIFLIASGLYVANGVWILIIPESLGYRPPSPPPPASDSSQSVVPSVLVSPAAAVDSASESGPGVSYGALGAPPVVVGNGTGGGGGGGGGNESHASAESDVEAAFVSVESHGHGGHNKLNPLTSIRYVFKSRYFTLVALCSFFYKVSESITHCLLLQASSAAEY